MEKIGSSTIFLIKFQYHLLLSQSECFYKKRLNENCSYFSKKYKSKSMSKWNTKLSIKLRLESKYDMAFHFYMRGSIDRMVQNYAQTETVIAYKDFALLSQELEFMRRQYWLINNSNQPQIYDRISMLSNFYSNNPFLTWEYPMMILTQTKKIFIRRFRRLRKMLSFDNSSDGEQTPQSVQNQDQSTVYILNDTYSSSSLDFSAISVLRECASFDSDTHNIYNNEGQNQGKLEIEDFSLLQNRTQALGSLVIDFNDLDAKQTVDNFLELKKRLGSQKRESLQNLYNKRIYTSIVLDDRLNQVYDNNPEKKVNRIAQGRRGEGKRYLNDRRRTIDNRITKEKEQQFKSKRKRYEALVKEQPECISQKIRKPKIRDKAAQLLNRVKTQDYTGGRKEKNMQ